LRARILRSEEWERIKAPSVPEMLRYVDPRNLAIVVVEDEGEVVASVCVLRMSHFEGLWIRPDKRGNAGVFRALIRQAYAVPRAYHEQFAIGGAENGDDRMDDICSRLGGEKLDVDFYVMPVGG
jgi:hypothetical protein